MSPRLIHPKLSANFEAQFSSTFHANYNTSASVQWNHLKSNVYAAALGSFGNQNGQLKLCETWSSYFIQACGFASLQGPTISWNTSGITICQKQCPERGQSMCKRILEQTMWLHPTSSWYRQHQWHVWRHQDHHCMAIASANQPHQIQAWWTNYRLDQNNLIDWWSTTPSCMQQRTQFISLCWMTWSSNLRCLNWMSHLPSRNSQRQSASFLQENPWEKTAYLHQKWQDMSSSSLHKLLIQCWTESSVPQDLKDANIITLYKNKGDTGVCNNYRGISLLGIIGSCSLSSHLKDCRHSLRKFTQNPNVASDIKGQL